MHPVLVTPPVELPIDAADTIKRAPALEGADKEVVTALIEAAVSHLDGWTGILGRCLVEQTWSITYDDHCRGRYGVFADTLKVTKVSFRGVELPEDDYDLRRSWRGPYVEVHRYPEAAFDPRGELTIEFTAGYGAADKVPAAIKQAIVMMVAGMFATVEASGGLRSEDVEGVSSVSFNSPELVARVRSNAVDMLLAPFRRLSV